MQKMFKEIQVKGDYRIPSPPCRQCREGQGERECYLLSTCQAWGHQGTVVQFDEKGSSDAVKASLAQKLVEYDLYTHGKGTASDIHRGIDVHVYCRPSNSVILKRTNA